MSSESLEDKQEGARARGVEGGGTLKKPVVEEEEDARTPYAQTQDSFHERLSVGTENAMRSRNLMPHDFVESAYIFIVRLRYPGTPGKRLDRYSEICTSQFGLCMRIKRLDFFSISMHRKRSPKRLNSLICAWKCGQPQ